MIRLAVIADDLTGANDTAVQFAKHRIRSCVKLSFARESLREEDGDVVVIDTDSRDIPAGLAKEKVKNACRLLKKSGAVNVYKKVDSTLRGNLGAEIEAAAEVFSPDVVVIAPAFPGNKRMTVGGYHLLDCVPIELTEIARAPKSPVRESRVIELLQKQASAAIGLVPLHIVIQGEDAIGKAIEEFLAKKIHWIVFDTVRERDLQAIVGAAKRYEKVLWVGSAGLADCLPAVYSWSGYRDRTELKKEGRMLLVSGSVSAITQRQIAEVLKEKDVALVKLDIPAVFENERAEIERCTALAKEFAARNKHVVLAGSVSEADAASAAAQGKRRGMEKAAVSEKMACVLGEISRGLTAVEWAGLVLTGGDTAVHVCRALAADEIEVLVEVAVGIPMGRLRGGVFDGLRVITKAGAFGEADSFVKAIHMMQEESGGEDR